MGFPKLKKKVNAFLLGDDGKISKNNILSIGALLSGAAISSALVAKDAISAFNHLNNVNITYGDESGSMNGTHVHHGSHSSHGSHGSHGSHSSHGSHGSHGQW